jgi:hypothetical protein
MLSQQTLDHPSLHHTMAAPAPAPAAAAAPVVAAAPAPVVAAPAPAAPAAAGVAPAIPPFHEDFEGAFPQLPPHVLFGNVPPGVRRGKRALAAVDQPPAKRPVGTLKWRCGDCKKWYATEEEAREDGPQHGLGCRRGSRADPLAAADKQVDDLTEQVDELKQQLDVADKQVNDLTVMLAERDEQVDELKQQALADSVQQANLTADHKELQELHRCPVCKEDRGVECIFLGRPVDGTYPCGHGTCMKCYQHLRSMAVANSLGEQDRLAKCPLCNKEIFKMHPFAGHKSVYVV